MENIGDKILMGNPENLMDLKVLEINDVYEVSPRETFFEIIEYRLVAFDHQSKTKFPGRN